MRVKKPRRRAAAKTSRRPTRKPAKKHVKKHGPDRQSKPKRSRRTPANTRAILAVAGTLGVAVAGAPPRQFRIKRRLVAPAPGRTSAAGNSAFLEEADCRAFAALGHMQRARMLAMLLGGPGTYQSLQSATGLRPGPLYHHIHELRLAGLIAPKVRNNYELTPLGLRAVVIAAALGAE